MIWVTRTNSHSESDPGLRSFWDGKRSVQTGDCGCRRLPSVMFGDEFPTVLSHAKAELGIGRQFTQCLCDLSFVGFHDESGTVLGGFREVAVVGDNHWQPRSHSFKYSDAESF